MIVSVRVATGDDATELARLARLAAGERADERGGVLLDLLEPRPAVGAGRVLLGLIDDVPFGFAQAHIQPVADLGDVAVVDDLYVEPPAREVGVGECLMDALLEWAAGAGCVGVDAVVLPGNRAGKNFFERYGLVARAIRVHRRLD